jgi:hypothetical protein
MTVANIDDAKILVKATKAKLVLVSAQMQSCYGRPTSKVLQEVDPTITLVVLDENFSMLEPGDAAQKLLSSVDTK